MSQRQRLIILLEDSSNFEEKHFRVTTGSTICFQPCYELQHCHADFFTNYPIKKNKKFSRKQYHSLYWKFEQLNKIKTVELKVDLPGSYHFKLVTNGEAQNCLISGYLVVDPHFPRSTIDRENNVCSISWNNLNVQTVVSKCLGPIDKWSESLNFSSNCGYNAIHFTPFHEFGSSRSSYSLKSHSSLDSLFGGGDIDTVLPPVLKELRRNIDLLFVDVVLNHMSNDAPFIIDHPEATYNLDNSPHLRPAFLVDRCLFYLNESLVNRDMFQKQLKKGVTYEVLNEIKQQLKFNLLPKLKLHEFYIINTEKVVEMFKKEYFCIDHEEFYDKSLQVYAFDTNQNQILSFSHSIDDPHTKNTIHQIQDPHFRRNSSTAYFKPILENAIKSDSFRTEETYLKYLGILINEIRKINSKITEKVDGIIEEISENVSSHAKYHFLDQNGPKWSAITRNTPLVYFYFSINSPGYCPKSIENDEKLFLQTPSDGVNNCLFQGKYVMAHQGWIYGDSTQDFAGRHSEVYIRRQLVVWGDSVKLRYGKSPTDCPALWNYIEKYIAPLATLFDGFRLDNCHSTPLCVLEHIVDFAREINPNLFLIAELFTNSEKKDLMFVNKLGITCLVRERLNAGDVRELCRFVHRFGSKIVGDFYPESISESEASISGNTLRSSIPRPLFYDITHDNAPLHNVFSKYEYVPTLSFISMATCPIGSTRGFDEILKNQISVVSEIGRYQNYMPIKNRKSIKTSHGIGISDLRYHLNEFRKILQHHQYEEIYVDQVSESIITVTRSNSVTRESYIMVIHVAGKFPDLKKITPDVSSDLILKWNSESIQLDEFREFYRSMPSTNELPVIKVPGILEKIYLECTFHGYSETNTEFENCNFEHVPMCALVRKPKNLTLNSNLISFSYSDEYDSDKCTTNIHLDHFPVSSVVILKCIPHSKSSISLQNLHKQFETYLEAKFWNESFKNLSLIDLNFILFKCSQEEREYGRDVYDLPGYGKLVYAGIYGFEGVLWNVRRNSDLGHPICENLRSGNWLMDFCVERLKLQDVCNPLATKLSQIFDNVKAIPRYLIPCYFDRIICHLFQSLKQLVFTKMSLFIQNGDEMVKHLALSTVALIGNVCSNKPFPVKGFTSLNKSNASSVQEFTLAAGLPHFSTSWMRCWGRDILLSLKGSLLLTNRIQDAKYLLLGITGCISSCFLVPNLISDAGSFSRYNCRDATWLYCQAIKDYCVISNDFEILKCKSLVIPKHLSEPITVEDVIQGIMKCHINEIKFVEPNAGPNLDPNMNQEGFVVTAKIDLCTGLVYGGNQRNCGTWMDKMGSSKLSGNYSIPATPRDGAAVELSALCYSVVSWLKELFISGIYPHEGVELENNIGLNGNMYTWAMWEKNIFTSFDDVFWIPIQKSEAAQKFSGQANLIHRLGIYKDIGAPSSQEYSQFQLRPNFLIAMKYAPQLFTEKTKALSALTQARNLLEGVYGMKTLDPSDWAYRGDYNNSVDSTDFSTSLGFNYHQGPEWLWLVGPYLTALLNYSKLPSEDTNSSENGDAFYNHIWDFIHRLHSLLISHPTHRLWCGLPELTQSNGVFCEDSCPIQSWSVSQILEVLFDLDNQMKSDSKISFFDSEY